MAKTEAQLNQELADLNRKLKAAEAARVAAEKDAERARAEAKAATTKAFTLKVGDKGGVVIHGIKGAHSKFGMTAYPVTLQELFARRDEIERFIEENRDALSWSKPVKA